MPPVSEEDIRKDPISTIGKPRRGNYQRMIRGFNNRKAKNLGSSWPPIRNLFWEEYLIEEEKTHQSFIERSANWHRVSDKKRRGYKTRTKSEANKLSPRKVC